MRYEPAMKYGLLVGGIGAALAWLLGVQLTEEQLGAIAVLLPVIQGVVQGWLTRRKVTPVAKLQDMGHSTTALKGWSADMRVPRA